MSGTASDSLRPVRWVRGQTVISNRALEIPEHDANRIVAAIDRPACHKPRHGKLSLERRAREVVHSYDRMPVDALGMEFVTRIEGSTWFGDFGTR
jgi:hypothetical protein